MEGERGHMISSSSLSKFEGSEGTAQQVMSEESGWTQYLEGFSSDHQRGKSSYSNDGSNYGSPSLVSDAASPSLGALSDMPKFNKKGIFACSTNISGQHFPKKLNVKKQRTKNYCVDDLEDTASSPVNSPKGRKSSSGDHLPQSDERSSKIIAGKNHEDYGDLKKRGLCLMPFTMLVNYLG